MAAPGTQVFVGLDLGTTGVKAVAFDEEDRALAAAVVATPTRSLPGGGAEYDADDLWAAACRVLREVGDQARAAGHEPVAVAIASMGEAGVLVDDRGHPTAPVIAWFDPRTEPQAGWWGERVGVEATQRIAGLTPKAGFGGAKMVWTRDHLPDAWAAGRRWLNMADWAAFRLSGEMATDHSLASRTMLFDLTARQWSRTLADAAGIDLDLLAPLVESGAPIGRVTAAAAAETGLGADAVVGAGGQDHVCAALALGVTEPAMLLDSIGTAEAFFLVLDEPDATGRIARAGISQGAHVAPDRTYAMTGLAQGGGRIDAARKAAGLDWPGFLATAEAEAVIAELAADGQARIDAISAAAGTVPKHHIVTGGGSRNARLIERKAELANHPITVADEQEATALGAAHLARRAFDAAH